MIIGIGTDIIEVQRIKKAIEEYGERFLKRICTQTEIEYCEQFNDKKFLHYAARFAAKEAFSKAIGTGFSQGFKANEIGVANADSGKPSLVLQGDMQKKWGEYAFHISLSHTESNATACVIMEKQFESQSIIS